MVWRFGVMKMWGKLGYIAIYYHYFYSDVANKLQEVSHFPILTYLCSRDLDLWASKINR